MTLELIEAGLKSRVEYSCVLFAPRTGLFSLFGDDKIFEKTAVVVGYKDFYENVYVIEDEKERKTIFTQKEDFIKAFASFSRFPLDEFIKARAGDRSFLNVRVTLYPVQLVVPLTFLYLLPAMRLIESDEVTLDFTNIESQSP